MYAYFSPAVEPNQARGGDPIVISHIEHVDVQISSQLFGLSCKSMPGYKINKYIDRFWDIRYYDIKNLKTH